MRYLVTPAFSEKVTSAGGQVLEHAGKAIFRIEHSTQEDLQRSALLVEDDPQIYAIRDKEYRLLFTFGTDDEGQYALILDLVVHGGSTSIRPLRKSDPDSNFAIDPRRNIMINPTKNLMIDPNRNLMIDPRRNMMIDPRRNLMIDPKRNMMIDVKRNMMLDPRKNFALDPKRNWQINPKQNSAWDGPLIYDLSGRVSGFIVRANEQVALSFKTDGEFVGSAIKAGEKNLNLFDREGSWTGFMAHNAAEGYNQFDLQGRWVGFLVGDPQLAAEQVLPA